MKAKAKSKKKTSKLRLIKANCGGKRRGCYFTNLPYCKAA